MVATVDGDPVDAADVNQIVSLALRGQAVTKDALPGLEAQALEHVIASRLVTKFLDSQQITVSDAEVTAALQTVKNQLASQKRTFADYLALVGMNESTFRKDLTWKLRWAKYYQSVLNDAELQKFFDLHRSTYDGRELHVSHILFRAERPPNQATQDALLKKAEQVRADIEAGAISFVDAARKYSNGPSRRQGGDLGYISRNGVMAEEFSKAAFSLEKDQVSKPVLTPFGVHLIQWTDARPGTKTLKEVLAEVQPAAIQDLFQRLADKMRADSKIAYTGAIPYFDPETKQIVLPEPKAASTKDGATKAPADKAADEKAEKAADAK